MPARARASTASVCVALNSPAARMEAMTASYIPVPLDEADAVADTQLLGAFAMRPRLFFAVVAGAALWHPAGL